MSVVAGAGTLHTCRLGVATSKFASLAIVGTPVGAARETDPFLLPTSTQRRFLPGTGEGFLAEQVDVAGKQDKPAACSRPQPPPAPRLRPSLGKAVVPLLALESEDESEEEDLTPKCPAAPRLSPKVAPPLAAFMPELLLPPSISSVGADEWDEGFGLKMSGPDEGDSEADGGNGLIDASTLNRMVSANASTACADDLEDRCPIPGLPNIYDNKFGENQF